MPATPAWPPASTPRLFIDQSLGPDAAPVIDGSAAHYLLGVMRLKVGDPVLLFDNRTGEWLATVAERFAASATLRIERRTRAIEGVPDLWLCFAPVKKARLDWIIEKATELGVARLQPVITDRTIVERVKRERIEAQIIEACEQCGRTALPELAEPVKLPRLLSDWPAERTLLFADREREALLAHAAVRRLALGPRILRAETAGLAAVSLWMAQHGDWTGG